MPAPPRPLTFLSDYGLADDFVGVCHGILASRAPGARVLDVTHGIPRHDVRTGALTLRRALPYFPPGVHLAVVDPEVGTQRRAIAVLVAEDDRLLVGPDNGLLSLAAARFGGIVEAVDVTRSPHRLPQPSATFHGRDLFAPVAAALAAGGALADQGDPIDADEVAQLEMPLATVDVDGIVAHALGFDTFGNVMLDVEHQELVGSGLRLGLRLQVNDHAAIFASAFADVAPGELLVYEDAYRTLSVAVNRGSARGELGLAVDDEVVVRPA